MGVVRKTIIAAVLLGLASGCVEQQERHAPIGSGPVDPSADANEQECQEQCDIDHDQCLEGCAGPQIQNELECRQHTCAPGLAECREECGG